MKQVDYTAALRAQSALVVAARALAGSPHVVQIRANDWGLQHPLRCRTSLTGCPVHEYMVTVKDPPAPAGDYFINERADIKAHDGSPDPAIAFLAALDALDELEKVEVAP